MLRRSPQGKRPKNAFGPGARGAGRLPAAGWARPRQTIPGLGASLQETGPPPAVLLGMPTPDHTRGKARGGKPDSARKAVSRPFWRGHARQEWPTARYGSGALLQENGRSAASGGMHGPPPAVLEGEGRT